MKVHFISSIIGAALLINAAGTVSAHEDEFGKISVTHPFVSAAPEGGMTRLRMKIINDGYDAIHITGFTSAVASPAKVIFAAGYGKFIRLKAITIAPNSAINFRAAQIWFELINLQKDLNVGDHFGGTLHLTNGGEIEISVIVGEEFHPHEHFGLGS